LVLGQCRGPFIRDKKGYDKFDAYTVRDILEPDIFGITELEDEEVEYLRQKLLRYKNQAKKLAEEFGIPRDKIEENIKKIDEPIAEGSIIIHGQVKPGCPYGRISLKWVKKNSNFFNQGK
ncbi:unnamed protein product, partial [marine sediment metagenome]